VREQRTTRKLNDVDRKERRMNAKPQQLGAQDPELKNSPVAWESDEDTEALREEIDEEPVCFFNDRAYSHGTVVSSGSALLRCDHGIWVPTNSGERGKR
jgi:hypothetical protein